jgi:hypothetical protein
VLFLAPHHDVSVLPLQFDQPGLPSMFLASDQRYSRASEQVHRGSTTLHLSYEGLYEKHAAALRIRHAAEQVVSYSEKILDDTVKGEKRLGLASRFESAPLPFPLAGRRMRRFGAIVGVTLRGVSYIAKDRSYGGRVAS